MAARREDVEDIHDEGNDMLDAEEVGEEVPSGDEGDVAMDSDNEEIQLQNDSIAYFDEHADSVFGIAQHPIHPSLIVTGGSEGDADDAPGKGYVVDTSAAAERPVLPASYSGAQPRESTQLDAIFAVEGHTDSINTLAFTLPNGDFLVEGGLYSIAVEPNGAYLAVGGAGGQIRIVSLPRLASAAQGHAGAGKGKSAKGAASQDVTSGGQILAALQTQADSIETLSFTQPTGGQPGQQTTLLAAGSVDGSIVVFDATRRFAVRKNLVGAHEDFSVVKVEFVKGTWLLTSCGMDGVVRRWDLRGGAANPNAAGAANSGLVKEWKGHLGDGEGGGVLGFVQGATGERVITAGDDGVVLVFEA
ncbi:hypothetical protein HYQ45_017517 [Verticillium longisporum]|uniref:Uncharacterized protein n=1 Tax=Verticillium longisporum TaxID=100787 RepID=A0A8I2Z2B3_VERLO|nr:hypothetical protein HYQ45_017517 [Verticillium longisporum]